MSSEVGRSSSVKAGAVLSYAVIGVQFVVAMLYTPTVLRLMGPSEFGLYSLVLSIVAYLSLISFGLGDAYIRFFARFTVVGDWDALRRLNGMFLMLFGVMGIVATLFGLLMIRNVEAILGSQYSAAELQTARILFAIMVANLALTFPFSLFSSFVIAHERFVFQKVLQIVGALIVPMIVVPVLMLGHQAVGMALAVSLVNFAISLRTAVYARVTLQMRFYFRGLNFSLLREVWVFSSFLFLNMLVNQINWNVDRFIIGRFLGAIPVAVYAVAAIFNLSYIGFSTAISNVFVPRIHRMISTPHSAQDVRDLFVRVGRIQFLVLGLVLTGFMFFGRAFIELWAGGEYVESYAIAVVLMVPVTIPLIQNLGIEIQKARNLHQFRSWVYFAVALGNVVLSIPLTQRCGAIGAASATAIALVVGNVIVMNWHYGARVGLDVKVFWREISRVAVGMLPAVLFGLAMLSTVELSSIVSLGVFGAIYILVYWSGAWVLGMNDYEKDLFLSVLQRLPLRPKLGR